MSVDQVSIELWNHKIISPLGGNLSDDETDTFHSLPTPSSSATSLATGAMKKLTMDIFLQNYNSHQNKYEDSDTFGPDTIAAFGAADLALSVPMGRGSVMASKSNISPNTPTTEKSAREGSEMTEQLEPIHVAPPFDVVLNDCVLDSEENAKSCNAREMANELHHQQFNPSSSTNQMQKRHPVSQITIRYQENEEEGFQSESSQQESIQTSFDDSGVPSDVLETSSSEEVSLIDQSLMEHLPSPFNEKTKNTSENSQEMELSKYLTPSEIETETRHVFIDITNARRRPSTSQISSNKNQRNESLKSMQKAFVDKFEQRQQRIDSIHRRRENHKSTQPFSAQNNAQCTILAKKDDTSEIIDLQIRQEAALRQTELEREAARSWAQAERESVRKCAEYQRNRINTDTACANNVIVVPQRVAELRECQQWQEEVDALRATIEKLQVDLKQANDRHHTIELELKERIQEQTERANKLEKLLMSKSSEPSETSSREKETTKENSKWQYNLAHVKNSKETKELLRHNNRGRTERVLGNGRKIITYGNGTEKEVFPDGTSVIRFLNGDIKMTYENDGVVVYYYATSKTTHTSYPDGSATYEFSNKQKEYHYPDGKKKIVFVDGTKKIFYPTGKTEIQIPVGLHDVEKSDGTKEITQQ
eukprot:scaffold57136_cov47-Attheya_sp.AAC.6